RSRSSSTKSASKIASSTWKILSSAIRSSTAKTSFSRQPALRRRSTSWQKRQHPQQEGSDESDPLLRSGDARDRLLARQTDSGRDDWADERRRAGCDDGGSDRDGGTGGRGEGGVRRERFRRERSQPRSVPFVCVDLRSRADEEGRQPSRPCDF